MPRIHLFLFRDLSSLATLSLIFVAFVGGWVSSGNLAMAQPQSGWTFDESQEGKITVKQDGQLRTALLYQEFQRPILYPIQNGHQQGVTRNWPIVEGVTGEANDHPHHKSLWFGHGDVNGASFWDESARIKTLSAKVDAAENRLVLENQWMVNDQAIASDVTTIEFGKSEELPGWWIDYQVEVRADQQDLKFGDTKEGTFAIRTHPNLRLQNDPSRNVTTAAGHALNQSGDTDKQLWGKRSPWVAYWGPIQDQTTTLVLMDHPTNLRHPTTWHAREYGLVAANPFGLSYFEKKAKSAGDYVLHKGQTLNMRYRLLIADKQISNQEIEQAYDSFRQSGR